MIDVVEGTALMALEFMEAMAKNRKPVFNSMQEVTIWNCT